jgi:uncharacterized protein DUF4255/carboxypeptidase family protein
VTPQHKDIAMQTMPRGVVRPPFNTMLADLDETVRGLLERELGRHGFGDVNVAFNTPKSQWSSTLAAPTINVFLYHLGEARDRRSPAWKRGMVDGQAHERRPPLAVEVCYAITAWTKAAEDEHRLLSQVLGILFAHSVLPEQDLVGALAQGNTRSTPVETRVLQTEKSQMIDLWSTLEGQCKPSIDYAVYLYLDSGTTLEGGPEVRTHTVRTRGHGPVTSRVVELHAVGGAVTDRDGRPLPDVLVTLDETGRFASTDAMGRFRFDHLTSGRYHVRARTTDGRERRVETAIPGRSLDLVVD